MAFPEELQIIIVRKIHSCVNRKKCSYFNIELFDGNFCMINEEDLIRYFPKVYHKYLMDEINS